MRIALDVSMLGREGGIPAYAESLVAALGRLDAHELVLWSASAQSGTRVREVAPAHARIVETSPTQRMLARLGLYLGMNPLAIESLAGPVDVFHGLNYLLPSRRSRAARVVTVHDLSLLHHPGWHPASRAWLYRRSLGQTLHGAHRVVTDTETIRAEVIERVGLSPERVTAIHLAPTREFRPRSPEELRPVLERHELRRGEYLLFTGALEPRKNVGRLLDALDRLRERHGNAPPLVITGPPGWRNQELRTRAASSRGALRVLGYLSRADVAILMAGALALVLPSLYEGFGLPVLEAMACGTPVVASRIGALSEIAADAALLVNPTETEDIAEGIRRVVEDSCLREDLAARGLARAATFSWERTAVETLRAYTTALASR